MRGCRNGVGSYVFYNIILDGMPSQGLGTSYNIGFSTIHYVILILALMEEDSDYLEGSLI